MALDNPVVAVEAFGEGDFLKAGLYGGLTLLDVAGAIPAIGPLVKLLTRGIKGLGRGARTLSDDGLKGALRALSDIEIGETGRQVFDAFFTSQKEQLTKELAIFGFNSIEDLQKRVLEGFGSRLARLGREFGARTVEEAVRQALDEELKELCELARRDEDRR